MAVIFSSFFDTAEKRTTSCQAEDDDWRVRIRRQQSKKVDKMSYQGVVAKSSSVPRENPENADAAAKLAFIQGRRKPVGRGGRQAKAACRFRRDGWGFSEITWKTVRT